jgi:signal transduction histidine kinase
LAIARESVETNGGLIRARNLPGKGCVFTIDLPLMLKSAKATEAHVAAALG